MIRPGLMRNCKRNAFDYGKEPPGSRASLMDMVPQSEWEQYANDNVTAKAEQNRWTQHIHCGAAIISAIPPTEPFITGFMVAHGYGANLAIRGTGKTIIGLDVLLRAASDQDWHGIDMQRSFYAVCFCGEDAPGTVLNIQAWCRRNSLLVPPARFVFVDKVPDLLNEEDCRSCVEAVKALIGQDSRAICMIDTWQRATERASQSDDDAMQRAAGNLEQIIAAGFRGPAIANAHPPKNNPHTICGSITVENRWPTNCLNPVAATGPENS